MQWVKYTLKRERSVGGLFCEHFGIIFFCEKRAGPGVKFIVVLPHSSWNYSFIHFFNLIKEKNHPLLLPMQLSLATSQIHFNCSDSLFIFLTLPHGSTTTTMTLRVKWRQQRQKTHEKLNWNCSTDTQQPANERWRAEMWALLGEEKRKIKSKAEWNVDKQLRIIKTKIWFLNIH